MSLATSIPLKPEGETRMTPIEIVNKLLSDPVDIAKGATLI
jgi:hypothetical protein